MKTLLAISLLLFCVSARAQDEGSLLLRIDHLANLTAARQRLIDAYAAPATIVTRPDCDPSAAEAWVTDENHWNWDQADWDDFNQQFAPIVFGDDAAARSAYFRDAAEQMGYTCDR